MLFILILTANTATGAAVTPPLFASDEPISITITAPMRDLIRQRKDKKQYDALLQFTDSAGDESTFSVKLSPRGNSRLEVCAFPPLRITIDPETVVGSVFEGQRRLKLVTKCNSDRDAAAWLLLEYGIYRAYNEVTPNSFRVRRVEVTYRDTESQRWHREQTNFLIESIAEAGVRLQREAVRPPRIEANQLNRAMAAQYALLQFMVGNTDYAVKRGSGGEGCCHNGRALAAAGRQKDWVMLPYDFDQAGLVNTDYALPDKRFRIRNVSQRLYRGFCWHNEETIDAIALFNSRHDQIIAALLPKGLSKSKARRSRSYVEGFYEIINDEENMQGYLLDKCRGSESLPIRETTISTNDTSRQHR